MRDRLGANAYRTVPGSRLWLLFGLLLLLMAARGFAYITVMPPFDAWDEYQHVAYIDAIATGGPTPVLGETNVSDRFMDKLVESPQHRFVLLQIGRLGAIDYNAYWARRASGAPPWKTSPAGTRKPGAMELYEAQHGPLYYRLVAPLYSLCGGAENLVGATVGLRVLNLLFTLSAACVVFWGLERSTVDRRLSALTATLVAVHPLFLINGVRVANDALGVLLASIVAAACMTCKAGWNLRRGGLIGVALGLACLAKAINFALIPFVLWCWLGSTYRVVATRRRSSFALVICFSLTALLVQSEVRGNFSRFGGLTPMQEAVKNKREGKTTADFLAAAKSIDWPKAFEDHLLKNSLLVCGWGFVKPEAKVIRIYEYALGFGLSGWAGGLLWRIGRRLLGRPSQRRSSHCRFLLASSLVLCASLTAALAYHILQSKTAWGYATTNPWYAAVAFPWLLLLAIEGGRCALGGSIWGARIVGVALLIASILAESTVVLGRLPVLYTGGLGGFSALGRLAELQPAWMGSWTLVASVVGSIVLLALAIEQSIVFDLRSSLNGPSELPTEWEEHTPRGPLSRQFTRRRLHVQARSAILWSVVFFVGGQAGLGWLLRARPWIADKEFGGKLVRLEALRAKHPGKPLLLALGSSRMATGFDPKSLRSLAADVESEPFLAFNFAMVGSGPEMMHLTLERLIDRKIKPQRVVVEFWPPFWSFARGIKDYELQIDIGSLEFNQARLLSRYVHKPSALMKLWARSLLLPAYENRRALLAAISPSWFGEEKVRDLRLESVDSDGFWRPHEEIRQDQRLQLIGQYKEHYAPILEKIILQDSSIRSMRGLLRLCKNEGIEAVVVVLPEGSRFRSWYSESSRCLFEQYLEELRTREGAVVVNAREWSSDELFLDDHHLLPAGAKAFTQRLAFETLPPKHAGRPGSGSGAADHSASSKDPRVLRR